MGHLDRPALPVQIRKQVLGRIRRLVEQVVPASPRPPDSPACWTLYRSSRTAISSGSASYSSLDIHIGLRLGLYQITT